MVFDEAFRRKIEEGNALMRQARENPVKDNDIPF